MSITHAIRYDWISSAAPLYSAPGGSNLAEGKIDLVDTMAAPNVEVCLEPGRDILWNSGRTIRTVRLSVADVDGFIAGLDGRIACAAGRRGVVGSAATSIPARDGTVSPRPYLTTY
jgi:hypothetical protein